jgi:hypothetical protein
MKMLIKPTEERSLKYWQSKRIWVLENKKVKDIFFHSLGLRFIAKSIAELSNAFFSKL